MSQCQFPCKSGLIRGVVSFERDNIVSFYYLGESEIWPVKRHGFWWEWPYNRGTMYNEYIFFSNQKHIKFQNYQNQKLVIIIIFLFKFPATSLNFFFIKKTKLYLITKL